MLSESRVNAVLFQCNPTPPESLVITAARTATRAPLVLFAHVLDSYISGAYDLVLPALCSPDEWLAPLAELIEFCRHPERASPATSSPFMSPEETADSQPPDGLGLL